MRRYSIVTPTRSIPEHVEADHVEVSQAGALTFFRGMFQERRFVRAYAPGFWVRMTYDGEAPE